MGDKRGGVDGGEYLILAASLSMTLRSAPTASARSIYSPGKRQPSSTTLFPFPSAIPLPHLIPFLLLPLSPPGS